MILRNIFNDGINSFQLKCVGLLFMTLDHFAQYIIKNTIGGDDLLSALGRFVAPLFMFILTISLQHTRKKLTFAFRLYIAHIITCFLTLFLSEYGKELFGMHDQFSIFSTFFYTVWFIYISENTIQFLRSKENKKVFLQVALGTATIFIPIILQLFPWFNEEVLNIIIPNILTVPYSPFFVMMGVSWYYAKSNLLKAMILVLFSCISFIGKIIISGANVWVFFDFFSPSQFWMVLFLPFIFLYNGERGRPLKYFFYIYYPLHIFILMFIGQQLM
ncbi:TraX family protein [Lysinibacillus sp. NPDC056959]|uniref:TraX family protein n=1 Tax=Lysinibacillus sp. NPDC056959 TaxID=3345981 RepID=UPI0036362073